MTIQPVSIWQQEKGVTNAEFFLSKKEESFLYAEAYRRWENTPWKTKDEKERNEPIEQLSPKGLALSSYLYSQKDKSVSQPLIASTTDSFKN